MNTEVKDRHFQIVTEIKQEVIKLTQENLVLRNCWEKEQAENEQQRHRIRLLLEENALLRNQIAVRIEARDGGGKDSSPHSLENAAQKCQIEDLLARNEALTQGFFVADAPTLPFQSAKRVHNRDDGTIFKGNKGNSPTR